MQHRYPIFKGHSPNYFWVFLMQFIPGYFEVHKLESPGCSQNVVHCQVDVLEHPHCTRAAKHFILANCKCAEAGSNVSNPPYCSIISCRMVMFDHNGAVSSTRCHCIPQTFTWICSMDLQYFSTVVIQFFRPLLSIFLQCLEKYLVSYCSFRDSSRWDKTLGVMQHGFPQVWIAKLKFFLSF